MFEKAGDFLLFTTEKYKFRNQACAALVCERVRNILTEHYPDHAKNWNPEKFERGVLSISAKNSAASSVLFMHTHEMIELFEQYEFPEKIQEIRIVRHKKQGLYRS